MKEIHNAADLLWVKCQIYFLELLLIAVDSLMCYECYENRILKMSEVSNMTVVTYIRRMFEHANKKYNDCYDENGVFQPSWANVTHCPSETRMCAVGGGVVTMSYNGKALLS